MHSKDDPIAISIGEYFRSPRAVLERADDQIDELSAVKLENTTQGGQPQLFERRISAALSIACWRIPKPPYRASAIAKDALNNIRSALDQTAYSSALALKSPKLTQTKFPFGDTETDARGDAKRRSRDLHPDITGTLLSFSPWKGGNDLLWSLNKARNVKEHRTLIPVGLNTEMRGFQYLSKAPSYAFHPYWDEREHALCFPLGPYSTSGIWFKLEFHLGDVGALAGQPAIPTLRAMRGVAGNIIEAVERKTLELI